jgi:hypothetical protein
MKLHQDADFVYPLELKAPPLIKTNQLPMDIVGPYAMIVKKHLSLVKNVTSTEEHEKALKGFPEKDRDIVTDIYKNLRDNGYLVKGLDTMRRIRIGIIIDNFHRDFENLDPVPKKITKELVQDFMRKMQGMDFDFGDPSLKNQRVT